MTHWWTILALFGGALAELAGREPIAADSTTERQPATADA